MRAGRKIGASQTKGSGDGALGHDLGILLPKHITHAVRRGSEPHAPHLRQTRGQL